MSKIQHRHTKDEFHDMPQPRAENRSFTGGNRFDAGTNVHNMPRVTNDNKSVRENLTNRMRTRTEPVEQVLRLNLQHFG